MTQRVLVAIDGSEASDRALAKAVTIAKEREWGLDLLHVIDTRQYTAGFVQTGTVDGKLLYNAEQTAEAQLDRDRAFVKEARVAHVHRLSRQLCG